MHAKLSLGLCALALLANGCVTIPNTVTCSPIGKLSNGAFCAETLTGKTSELTLEQFLDFLEAKEASADHPARAGAVCLSADDYRKTKTALEQACRELGKRCTLEMKRALQ